MSATTGQAIYSWGGIFGRGNCGTRGSDEEWTWEEDITILQATLDWVGVG
jgi:hypothetical protein